MEQTGFPWSDALAVLLIAPAPSIGVWLGLRKGKSRWGIALWMLAKVWLFGLPLFWHVVVDGQPVSFSPARDGGFLLAAGMGLAMSVVILAAWKGFRPWLSDEKLKEVLEPVGLKSRAVYLGAAIYWIGVNSVLEEYVYRWFLVSHALWAGAWGAIGISALVFVVHHVVAMEAYFPRFVAWLAGLGIFVGGVMWSWLYLHTGSIWPAYLSHAIVDLAIFAIGWKMLFSKPQSVASMP